MRVMMLIIIELSWWSLPLITYVFALVQIFRETPVKDASWLLQVSLQDHGTMQRPCCCPDLWPVRLVQRMGASSGWQNFGD